MKLSYTISILTSCVLVTATDAYKRDKNFIKITHSKRVKAYTPEEELASFELPEGFVIELVASEKNGIINPIDLTFDDAGRLWTQTAEMYPMDPFGDKANNKIRGELLKPNSDIRKAPGYVKLDRLYKLKDRGVDRVLLIENPTKKVEGEVKIVAKGLTMPQSILPYKNGVYVAHGSEMLYIQDSDNDGEFEDAKSVLTGFSFIDTHTMSHTLVRGPGGWVNFSHGAMNLGKVVATASGESQQINYSKIARFSLDGNKIELVSSGLNNIWGFQLRADGQWYGTEANDKSHSVVPMEPMTGFLGIGNDKLRPYQPMVPVVHDFRVGGTGISGLVFSDDDSNSFPEEWKNLAFLANPITNTINTVKIDRDAKGNIIATHLDDLLKSSDDWFRPVNMEFGPDGCLYIADWYNKVVSHNEIPRTDPSRDKTHGRIWRIRHKSQKPLAVPNLLEKKDSELAKHLLGNSRWEKRAAWHQIADRQGISLLPEVKKIALNTENSVGTRVHAIWSFESLKKFDSEFVNKLLLDDNHNVRREIIRSLASFDLDASTIADLLRPFIEDEHCLVRSQVLRTLEEVNVGNQKTIELLVLASKPKSGSNNFGGDYERNFERYLARKALEKYPAQLKTFLSKGEVKKYPISNLLWALQSLPPKDSIHFFSKFWNLREKSELDGDLFISLSNMLNNESIYKLTKPYFEDSNNYRALVKLFIENEDRVNRANLDKVIVPAMKSLIHSDSEQDKSLAIKVAVKLKSNAISKEILELAKQNIDKPTQDILSGLLIAAKKNKDILKRLATNNELSYALRLRTIEAYSRANSKEGMKMSENLIKGKNSEQIKSMISYYSQSKAGVRNLVTLVKQGKIKREDFDWMSAQRVVSAMKKNPTAKSIFAEVNKFELQRKAGLDAKVLSYVKAVETGKGNPEVGQAFFQSCLQCHQVGDQGYSIAPALDGSATRELHALVTAIVNPDVAVEGGYELYRVTRKDGTIEEGYLYKESEHGITIAKVGNTKVFIPQKDIKSKSGVDGKSFMPGHFSDLPDQMMVDLISYIKTLN